ncbi:hypothetical protein [endosymbiont GvMRE of Glomus versiforme]|nr:hypothetical protein [endosymbiont GvMRE of Glomus versiforme]
MIPKTKDKTIPKNNTKILYMEKIWVWLAQQERERESSLVWRPQQFSQ